ncbi:TPA: hypothetical protein ACGR1M_002749 [Escherichia coli]
MAAIIVMAVLYLENHS